MNGWPSAGEEEEEAETEEKPGGDVEAHYVQGEEKLASLESASSNETQFQNRKKYSQNLNST